MYYGQWRKILKRVLTFVYCTNVTKSTHDIIIGKIRQTREVKTTFFKEIIKFILPNIKFELSEGFLGTTTIL